MTADQAVAAAAVISTIASYIDPVTDSPIFWVCLGALLGIMCFVAVSMLIVYLNERQERLPGKRP